MEATSQVTTHDGQQDHENSLEGVHLPPTNSKKRARQPQRPRVGPAVVGVSTREPKTNAVKAEFQNLQREAQRLSLLHVEGVEDGGGGKKPARRTKTASGKGSGGSSTGSSSRVFAHVLKQELARAAAPEVCVSVRALEDIATPYVHYDNDTQTRAVDAQTEQDVLEKASARVRESMEGMRAHVTALRESAQALRARAGHPELQGMLHIHERVLLEARANACDVAAAKIEAKYVQRQPELFALENPIFSVVTAVQAIRAREQEMVGQKGEVVQERGEGESSEGKTLLEVVNGIASRGTHRIKKGNRNRRPGAQFSPIDVLVARARGAMEENAAVFVDMGLCACGKIMQLTESNIFVCTRCKKTNKESSFFSADVDRSSLPRVGSHKSFTAAQRSMNHFLKRVDGFQGQVYKYFDEDVYLRLCKYFYDKNYCVKRMDDDGGGGSGSVLEQKRGEEYLVKDISVWDMGDAQQATGLNKVYDNYQQLRMMLTGKQPRQLGPVLASEIQIMVRMMFQVWLEFWKMIDDEDKRRRQLAGKPFRKRHRNAPNSSYCFLAAAHLRGHPEMAEEVRTVWAPDNVAEKERIRALVFATFGWEFVPLPLHERAVSKGGSRGGGGGSRGKKKAAQAAETVATDQVPSSSADAATTNPSCNTDARSSAVESELQNGGKMITEESSVTTVTPCAPKANRTKSKNQNNNKKKRPLETTVNSSNSSDPKRLRANK